MKNWVIRGLLWGIIMLLGTTFLFPWFDNEPIKWSMIWFRALMYITMGLALFLGLDKLNKSK